MIKKLMIYQHHENKFFGACELTIGGVNCKKNNCLLFGAKNKFQKLLPFLILDAYLLLYSLKTSTNCVLTKL
jgi:hypothetical protein